MNSDEYRTIKSEGEGYYTEKRSKFLAFAHHVETVEQIKDLLTTTESPPRQLASRS